MNPAAAAPLCKAPTLVLSGDVDKIVPPALSEDLYNSLGGTKLRILFEGGHNSQRPTVIYDVIRELAVGSFRGSSPQEILEAATALLREHSDRVANGQAPDEGHKDGKGEGKGGLETARCGDEDAESEAYQLAAEAEAALKNLLREKNVECLTEEDITRVLGDTMPAADMSATSESKDNQSAEKRSHKSKLMSEDAAAKGRKGSVQVKGSSPLAKDADIDRQKVESKSMRVPSTTPAVFRRTLSSVDARGNGGGTEPDARKVSSAGRCVFVRSFTTELVPVSRASHERRSVSSTRTFSVNLGRSSPRRYSINGEKAHSHSGSLSATMSSWFANLSFFGPATPPLTAEEKAVRDCCPAVASAWASLATAVALSLSLDAICDQVVSILVLLASGLQDMSEHQLSDLSPEQRELVCLAPIPCDALYYLLRTTLL